MMPSGVLLDTSFFLRFLNDRDPLFNNADGYFRFFAHKEIPMFLSTLSVAEYCVRGSIDDLPLRNVQIIPFNLNHAQRAGEFARTIFEQKGALKLPNRTIIPNDTNLFAQADVEPRIDLYLTSDTNSETIFRALTPQRPRFQFANLHTSHADQFGLLAL